MKKKLVDYKRLGGGCEGCIYDDDEGLCMDVKTGCESSVIATYLIPAPVANAADAFFEAVDIAIDSGEVLPISKARIQKARADYDKAVQQ